MASYMKIILIGNVGSEVRMRYTPQGTAVCDFSLAVNKVWGKGEGRKETTTWVKCTVWREYAETASKMIGKGKRLFIEASDIKASAYTAKDGKPTASLEVTVDRFIMLNDAKPGDQVEAGEPSDSDAPIDF